MTGEGIPVTTRKGRAHVQERLAHFDRLERFAVLATDNEGHPYTSLIAFAVTPDLKQVVFATPKATRKYRNIVKGKHVALLLDNRAREKKDVMSAEAITIVGLACPLRKGARRDEMAALFLEKHPDLTVLRRLAHHGAHLCRHPGVCARRPVPDRDRLEDRVLQGGS